jgi:hypothetical protein
MPIIWTLLQAAWIVVFIAIAVFTIRFVYRRSKLLGTILVAGTVVHTIVPAIFFSISWFNLPVLRELHTGDGFWVIAPDARTYFALASKASAEGLHTILQGSPSPSFIQAIAVWMDLVGVSPGSPLFFNLIAFVLTCGLIVRLGMSGHETSSPNALAWPLLTLSFSPTLLLCSAQVLKDVFFACLTVVVALSARELLTSFDRVERRPSRAALAGGFIGVCLGVYTISGLRAYYGVFIWLSLAATLGLLLFRQRRVHLARYVGAATAMLAVVWVAFMTGAGEYYPYYHRVALGGANTVTGGLVTKMIDRFSPRPAPGAAAAAGPSTGQTIDSLREGFVLSAGNTNLIRRPATPPGTGTPGSAAKPAEPAVPSATERLLERLRGTALGLVAMFVPITLLQALSIVDIQGGRGFLYVTDLDTLFIDFTIIGIGWLLIRERRALRHRQVYLFFCLTIALLSTILLAYVVTNLGTLFRLRLIGLVPFWMAPLAISRATQVMTVTAASPATDADAQSAWQPATSGADL